MDVIRKTAGEIIDELTEKEMMLEQKQEKLIAAVEAAGYRLQKNKAISTSTVYSDGTHRMQGHLFAKSWNESGTMGRSNHRKRRSDPERTCRASDISGTV